MESILTYRMNSTHPGIMMPEIGRVSIHKEGVKLISDWIDALPAEKQP
jgi:glucan phosphorylase